MARRTRCRVCHARDVEVDRHGRCLCCRMALWATTQGVTYGALMARLHSDGGEIDALDCDSLPPVADRRNQSRFAV